MRIMLITSLALASLWVETPGQAESWESLTDGSIPVLEFNPFQHNPALFASQPGHFHLGLLRFQRKTIHREIDGEDTLEFKTTGSTEGFGLQARTDLGGDAWVGLGAQRLFGVTETTLPNNTIPVQELHERNAIIGKMAVLLTTNLRFGVNLRYYEDKYRVRGNRFASAEDEVTYLTGIFGFGAGFAGTFDQLLLAGAYQWPLRGKTEILGEEKLIVEPGLTEIVFAYDLSQGNHLGLTLRRWLHERDEIADGTTTVEDNRFIDLRGLDPYSDIYVLQEFSLGGSTNINPHSTLVAAITQDVLVISENESLPTLESALPTADSEDLRVFKAYSAHVHGRISFDLMTLGVTAIVRQWHHEVINNNNSEQKDEYQLDAPAPTFVISLGYPR